MDDEVDHPLGWIREAAIKDSGEPNEAVSLPGGVTGP